jgi:ATP dependent DNA ligase domain
MSRAPAPEFVSPMKATLVGQLPAGNEWLYEIKWDGYRALAAKRGHSVRLLSLKNKNLSNNFPAVMEAVAALSPTRSSSTVRSSLSISGAALPFRCCRIAPRLDAIGRSSIMRLIY